MDANKNTSEANHVQNGFESQCLEPQVTDVKHSENEFESQTTDCVKEHSMLKPLSEVIQSPIEISSQEVENNLIINGSGNGIKLKDEEQAKSDSDRILRESLSLNNAHILGIGTSNPSIINYTKEVFANVKPEYERLGISQSDLRKLTSIYENCGIEKRYCHADFSKKSLTENVQEHDYEKFKPIAPQLAAAAATKAIEEWKGDVKAITHVVSCSCSGILVPDINFLLIQELGLNNRIERISVNMMGCFGALIAIKTAKALALQDPTYRVLIVCTEVCSLHYKPTMEVDIMLSTAIFGDGAGAMIIGCNPTENEKRIYEIIKTGSEHIPDTIDAMYWELTNKGWIMHLSPKLPRLVGDKISDVIKNFLNSVSFPISCDDCDWLIHPGGKNILLNIQDALNITNQKNISSWNVLKDFGNMSSATLLFVMDDARKRAPEEQYSVSLGCGPGLAFEMILLRKL